MRYKIGQTVKIKNTEGNPKKWPNEGQLLSIIESGILLAKYEVKQVDIKYIYGEVTNTYGHKRKSKKIS